MLSRWAKFDSHSSNLPRQPLAIERAPKATRY
jgi:hypothetical protein